jgi:hypothetical protein
MKAILLTALLMVATALSPAFAQQAKEKPAGAGIIADQIREGELSPGDKYNLEVGSRFHRIHTKFMAIGCQTCHAGVKFPENIQFLRREEFPLAAYPGAVDRGTCLGCHRGEDNLASEFYKVPPK